MTIGVRSPRRAVLAFATALAATSAWAPPAAAEYASLRMLERLKDADANRDGSITRAEFAAYRRTQFDRMDRHHQGFVTQHDIDQISFFMPRELEPDKMMAQFDANHDGQISREELANGPSPTFDLADANHDGIITPAEFAAAEAKLKQAEKR